MSRMPRAGGRYVQPIKSDGTPVTEKGPRGVYTLEASTLYYFVLGGADASFLGVQLTGYTAALIITSAGIQDTNHSEQDVSDFSSVVGEWVTEDPTTAFVACDGTGWSPTNGVVAVVGGNVGGAVWHLAEWSTARARLAVLVGATGGDVRVSVHGKD